MAANVLGGDEVYDPVPYSWSEQFGRMMQYAGVPRRRRPPDLARPGRRARPAAVDRLLAGRGHRLVALLAVDRPRDLSQGRRIMAAGTPVDPARLADPAVQLKNATTS